MKFSFYYLYSRCLDGSVFGFFGTISDSAQKGNKKLDVWQTGLLEGPFVSFMLFFQLMSFCFFFFSVQLSCKTQRLNEADKVFSYAKLRLLDSNLHYKSSFTTTNKYYWCWWCIQCPNTRMGHLLTICTFANVMYFSWITSQYLEIWNDTTCFLKCSKAFKAAPWIFYDYHLHQCCVSFLVAVHFYIIYQRLSIFLYFLNNGICRALNTG